MKILSIFYFLIIILNYSIADSITLENGQVYNGLIINATDSKVSIKLDKAGAAFDSKLRVHEIIYIFPKNKVIVFMFSRADIVSLKSGKEIDCKVISESINNIIIVNKEGLGSLSKVNIDEIRYNESNKLEVFMMPKTGKNFTNIDILPSYISGYKNSTYFKIHLGTQIAHIENKSPKYDFNSDVAVVKRGIEIGYLISPLFEFGIGAENYLPISGLQNVGNGGNYFSYSFYYLNSNLHLGRLFSSYWFFYSGSKLGVFYGKDRISTDNKYVNVRDTKFSFGINIGAKLREDYIQYKIEFLYLVSSRLSMDADIYDSYRKLNFSGLSLNLGISILPEYFN